MKLLSLLTKKVSLLLSTLLVLSSSLQGSKTTLVLVRHGETDWNKELKAQGQTDIPLNKKGISQAKRTAKKIKAAYPTLDAIYSSDLKRSLATAKYTAKKYGLAVQKRKTLREINRGEAEGMTREEIFRRFQYKKARLELEKKYPSREERWKQTIIPGEESLASLEKRVRKELLAICHAHPNQKVAVFFHGTAIKVFIASLQNCDVERITVPNCATIPLSFDSEKKEFILIDYPLFSKEKKESV